MTRAKMERDGIAKPEGVGSHATHLGLHVGVEDNYMADSKCRDDGQGPDEQHQIEAQMGVPQQRRDMGLNHSGMGQRGRLNSENEKNHFADMR